jgi:hypothetical protein
MRSILSKRSLVEKLELWAAVELVVLRHELFWRARDRLGLESATANGACGLLWILHFSKHARMERHGFGLGGNSSE